MKGYIVISILRKKYYFVLLLISFSTQSYAESKTPKTVKIKKDKFTRFVLNHLKKLNAKSIIKGNKRIETMDVNHDGKVDVESVYINNKLFTEKADYNHDGKFDKMDWYFQNGDILQTTTFDSNYDGKVDLKIVKTMKGATSGNYLVITYKDKDHDGKFDSKKTISYPELQSASSSQDSVNCSVDQYEDVHLPAILNKEDDKLLDELSYFISDNFFNSYVDNKDNANFQIKVQTACQREGPKENKDLFKETNIQNSLKEGIVCMGELNNSSPGTQASMNFRKLIAGLAEFDYNGTTSRRTDSRLKLICKLPEEVDHNWKVNVGGQQIQTYAVATTSYDTSRNEKITQIANDPPLIIFPPNLAGLLEKKKPDYPNQDVLAKFKRLVFHEYIHTSLGTTHATEENYAYGTIDYASACEDYCFRGPGQGSELIELSRGICGGKYPTASDDRYIRDMRRITSIKNSQP
jgi:hypothetical protein